jgi:hypothetical protein
MLRRARPSILNLNFAALPKQASAGFAFRAPMDFTGERFIPGQGAAAIAYEHVARYLLAQPLAAG